MDKHIKRKYAPMTETSFYILFALQNEMHGYNIMQYVKYITDDEIFLGAGTLYTSLRKMESDGLIVFVKSEGARKIYKITETGTELLKLEIKRIERVHCNIKKQDY